MDGDALAVEAKVKNILHRVNGYVEGVATEA